MLAPVLGNKTVLDLTVLGTSQVTLEKTLAPPEQLATNSYVLRFSRPYSIELHVAAAAGVLATTPAPPSIATANARLAARFFQFILISTSERFGFFALVAQYLRAAT